MAENGKKDKKEITPIDIPNSMFFPDYTGDRQPRRIYCQVEVAEGGTGHSLVFGLPKPTNAADLAEIYPGLDMEEIIRKAVLQHSYGRDAKAKEAVVTCSVNWAEAVPEENDAIKAIVADFQTALTTLAVRTPGETAKVKAKASEYDIAMKEAGFDPDNADDRIAFREIVKAAMARRKAKNDKKATK